MISKRFEIGRGPALCGYIACLWVCIVIPVFLFPTTCTADQPKIKTLVLPFYLSAADETRELITFRDFVDKKIRKTIESAGDKFEIAPKSVAMKLVAQNKIPRDESDIKSLTAVSNADFVIFGSVERNGNNYKFRGYMWQSKERKLVVSTEFSVGHVLLLSRVLNEFSAHVFDRLQGSPNLEFYPSESPGLKEKKKEAEFRPVSIDKDTGPWRSPSIPEALVSLDIGDMDGDKKNETVFLSQYQATIGKYENGALKTLLRFSNRPVVYINAEIEDIDGDGAAELLICYQTPKRLESAIITYKNRNFSIVQTFPNTIISMIDDPVFDGQRLLAAQKTDSPNMFNGRIFRMRMNEGKADVYGETALPPGTLLTSYVTGKLGKSKEKLRIILNQDQRLMVFDNENRLLSTVSDKIYGIDRKVSFKVGDQNRSVIFPGRLAIIDTNGDGEQELLVIKQTSNGSVVEDLVWRNNQLKQKWKTVGARGVISDFRIRDFKNQGARSLVLILVQPTPFPLMAFSGPSSVVYAYEMGM